MGLRAQPLGAVIPLMVLLCSLFLGEVGSHQPTTYVVGDEFGWDNTIDMQTWPRGKTFYAGDVLEFKYDYQEANVVVVNRTGFETCKANDGAKVYESGDDRIPLAFGPNYFIGTYYPEACAGGLKMEVDAIAPTAA